MGTVYEAYQRSMHRTVALKVLDVGAIPSRNAEVRFQREAWIGGRLSHPNIVKVYCHGVEGRSHYIAMELATGGSLHDDIEKTKAKRRGVPADSAWRGEHIRRVISLFISAADALAHIHAHGIIHRDIKPSNLLVPEEGSRLLLTDFGLAKDEEALSVTRGGDFLGTVRYMSPEQLLAHRATIDYRSDIWSLGVSLYEAATLSLPYSADSDEAYMSAVSARDPAPARTCERAVPRDLETVLMKCLQRDPAHRYQTAAALRDDLARLLENRPVLARRPGLATRAVRFASRNRISAGLVAAFVLVAVVALALGIPPALRQRVHERVISRLEAGEPAYTYMPPGADEQRLLDDMRSGRVSREMSTRVVRHLLKPDVHVSQYMTRHAPAVYADIERYIHGWELAAVVMPKVMLDGQVVAEGSVLPPSEAVCLLSADDLAKLACGQHRLDMELRAWVFQMPDVVSQMGEAGQSLWNPPLSFADEPGGVGRALYGPGQTTWSAWWPELQSSVRSLEVGPIIFPPVFFYVVDELPQGYPTPVSSPALDAAMRDNVTLDDFRCWGGQWFLFRLTVDRPLPAALACRVEATAPGWVGRLDDLRIRPGHAPSMDTMRPVRWERVVGESPPDLGKTSLGPGDGVTVRVRLIPSRDVAASEQGFDTYWGGTLEFEGVLHRT
jgi:hypothetical protein